MIALWVTLLVLHQGYSLVPVITVQLGEPATVTCMLPNKMVGSGELYWYKQSAADTLKLIAIVWETRPQYAPEFSESRLEVKRTENSSMLTILKTTGEDEGLYHCAVRQGVNSEWSGTYLLVKGNAQRTSNYTVVQWPTVSDPVRPGDSVTLQCSVLSDSDNKTCPGDHSVYWFRAGSNKSLSNIIYTDGNDKCEKRPDSLKSCVYRFSKTMSSSDTGTYYCAVATCGEIFFGNGTKLDIQGTSMLQMGKTIIFLLCVVLALSLTVIAILICNMKFDKNAAVALHTNIGDQKGQQTEEDTCVYSAVVFTMIKTGSGRLKAAEKGRIYTGMKAVGLNQ